MKKFLSITLLFFIALFFSGYKKPDVFVIDAQKNAQRHNNLGLIYVDEKAYYAAVQEFKIAISLNPNTQATAVYFNNLGETYMKIGYPKNAQECFEKAIYQYSLNLLYYQNLVKSFKAQKILDSKLKIYSAKRNPMSAIVVGLIYIEKGDLQKGVIKLDEFCMSEPDLLITPALKKFISTIVP